MQTSLDSIISISIYTHRRPFDLKNGKQSKGKFTHFKDLTFPKGCGSIDFDLQLKSAILQQISPLARSFQAPSTNFDDIDYIPSAQTLNEQFAPAPQSFSVRRMGNKNDGFYYPDFSGRYIHDNRGEHLAITL